MDIRDVIWAWFKFVVKMSFATTGVAILWWLTYALLFDESQFGKLASAFNRKADIAITRTDTLRNVTKKLGEDVGEIKKLVK